MSYLLAMFFFVVYKTPNDIPIMSHSHTLFYCGPRPKGTRLWSVWLSSIERSISASAFIIIIIMSLRRWCWNSCVILHLLIYRYIAIYMPPKHRIAIATSAFKLPKLHSQLSPEIQLGILLETGLYKYH